MGGFFIIADAPFKSKQLMIRLTIFMGCVSGSVIELAGVGSATHGATRLVLPNSC